MAKTEGLDCLGNYLYATFDPYLECLAMGASILSEGRARKDLRVLLTTSANRALGSNGLPGRAGLDGFPGLKGARGDPGR